MAENAGPESPSCGKLNSQLLWALNRDGNQMIAVVPSRSFQLLESTVQLVSTTSTTGHSYETIHLSRSSMMILSQMLRLQCSWHISSLVVLARGKAMETIWFWGSRIRPSQSQSQGCSKEQHFPTRFLNFWCLHQLENTQMRPPRKWEIPELAGILDGLFHGPSPSINGCSGYPYDLGNHQISFITRIYLHGIHLTNDGSCQPPIYQHPSPNL